MNFVLKNKRNLQSTNWPIKKQNKTTTKQKTKDCVVIKMSRSVCMLTHCSLARWSFYGLVTMNVINFSQLS